MKKANETAENLTPLGAFAAGLLGAFAAAVAYLFATFAQIAYVDAKYDGLATTQAAHGKALETMDARLWDMQGRPQENPPVQLLPRAPAGNPLSEPGK